MSACAQGDAHLAPIRVQHKFEGAEEEFTTATQDVTATDEIVDDSVTATDSAAAGDSTDLNSSAVADNSDGSVNGGQWGWGQGVSSAKQQRKNNNSAGKITQMFFDLVLVCNICVYAVFT
jgi:hypothetical protein